MVHRLKFFCAGYVCGLVLLMGSISLMAAPRIVELQAGLGKQSQLGYWTPVRVQVEAGEQDFLGELQLVTADSDGLATVYRGFTKGPVKIAAGKKQWLTGYVKFGRSDSGLKVRLVTQQGSATEVDYPRNRFPDLLQSTAARVIVVGAKLDLAPALTHSSQSFAVTHLPNFKTFPDRWYGLEGVRQIFITTSNPKYLEGLNASRMAALEQWLRLGGEVVICIGSQGAELLQAGTDWSRLISGRFQFLEQQWKTSGLEMYAGAKDPLELPTAGAVSSGMAVMENVEGRIEVFDGVGDVGQRPMVVRQLIGFGQLVFVAVDLDLPPFVDWPARSRLLRRLSIGEQGDASIDRDTSLNKKVSHLGYRDLTGQLRVALSQFEGVTLVRFYWIVGILIFYVILIGPLDYLLLKKWNRLHWSWITFPSIVLGFSLLTVVMSAAFKPDRIHVNQLDIVDYDVETSQLRGTTWAYVLSPQSQTYDLQIKPKSMEVSPAEQLACLCCWQGLPGSGLGGLNSRSIRTSAKQEYSIQLTPSSQSPDSGSIQGLPIQDASCRGLNARWWGNCSCDVVSRLYYDRQGVLQGEVSNPFPFALENCRLYYQNQVYVMEEPVESGEVLRISNLVDSVRAAEAYLLRRRLVRRSEASQRWLQSSTDLSRIVEMLMFHEKAGATHYTNLTHRYQGFLDLSEHLDWNRAILVGRASGQGSDLVTNGTMPKKSSATWTYYRLVFPISEAATP